MKRIDELNFSPLRWLAVVHLMNRIKYRIKRPRSFGALFVLVLIVHVLYVHSARDGIDEPYSFVAVIYLAILNFILNVVFVAFIYFMVQALISAFYGSFNYTFMKKFLEANKIPSTQKAVVGNNKLKGIVPTSVTKDGGFDILGEYSFSIQSSKGMQIDFAQFTMRIPVEVNPYFYFMSARFTAGKDKMAHFYLDSYKNGRSIMRLLKKESMKLEGDFSNYFRLYHTIGKETEVREVLTPDVMELLKEIKQPYDYEFDGESVWIIAKGYHCTEQDIKLLAKTADRLAHELK